MINDETAEKISAALMRLRGRRGRRRDGLGGPGAHTPHASAHTSDRLHHGPTDRGQAGHRHAQPEETRQARGLGGSPAIVRMTETLAASGRPLTVSEIADAIGVDQPRASRLVQQGAERGLVIREADPEDARRTRIALTHRGEGFAQRVRAERRVSLSRALEGFSDEEGAELARLLTKLADAWPH